MKIPFLILALIACLSAGCTHFKVTQNESGEGTNMVRRTTTSAWTFFDSKSELAKLRASTSDKTQSTSVGSLNAESSGSNAVSLFSEGIRAAIEATVKSVKPIP
jgi:hypothetical protein